MVITHQPQLIITDTGIPIVDILTNVLFKEQNEPSANMVLLKNLDDMVVVEDAYRAKIQSRFSRKQSLKRKIFILYFRLLFSRRIIPFPLVPPVTNHLVYVGLALGLGACNESSFGLVIVVIQCRLYLLL